MVALKYPNISRFAFLRNKSAMNVREIEFARAYRYLIFNAFSTPPSMTFRLTETVIECVSFTVPRVKSTHFQVMIIMIDEL